MARSQVRCRRSYYVVRGARASIAVGKRREKDEEKVDLQSKTTQDRERKGKSRSRLHEVGDESLSRQARPDLEN